MRRLGFFVLIALVAVPLLTGAEKIRVNAAGDGFETAAGETFVVWGVNYDHDEESRLLEEYWQEEWPRVEQDFAEIAGLGANVVRVHLQIGAFMDSASRTNAANLAQLRRLIALAERLGLRLDLTGLGCYRKSAVPVWYDALPEAGRWAVQARFWAAVADACAGSPAVFCYDLMNEPTLPGAEKAETEWLAGELGGFHFVQRIALDLAGRSREDVARAWVEKMTAAIREKDKETLVTVGVIPWALVFPKAKPLFHSPAVGRRLDFVAVHFYPETGKSEEALQALKLYDVGKPLVVEEMFPLKCSADEMSAFVRSSRPFCDGWISFYWGKTADEYDAENGIAASLKAAWLRRFQELGREIAADK